jgi:enoyl-CoA hydratase/carnithine racemase
MNAVQIGKYRLQDGREIPEIILSRPHQANAINPEVAKGLENALKVIEKSKNPLAILAADYSGQSSPVFCAGGDLKYYASLPSKSQGMGLNRQMSKVLTKLSNSSTVVFAVVEGKCIGGVAKSSWLAIEFLPPIEVDFSLANPK